ncbi:MAG TPA: sialidase family protein, partial [Micromonosporaceae bacterium]|nr:sialidase family protein [Micromonosporaceae bacterium]
VLGPDRAILALLHSADGGQTFTRTRKGNAGAPQSLAGAMVPLLDGRLLVAGGDRRWYISADDGATFTRAEGNLPAVGRLARTSAGYIAYDLFGGGWAAFSSDGSAWRKLQIN